jgi:hypothetical protein
MDGYITLIIVIAIALVVSLFGHINKRLQRMEAKLTAILHHLGVEQDILPEPSEKVKDLAKMPDAKIEAVEVVEEISLQERGEV